MSYWEDDNVQVKILNFKIHTHAFIYCNHNIFTRGDGELMIKDDLIMAHDNLQRELADIKRLIGKDKHALIKANIALNRRVEELERVNKQLKGNLSVYKGYYNSTLKHNKKLIEQNTRYRKRLEYMLKEAKDHKAKGLRIQHWALIKDLEQTLEESE